VLYTACCLLSFHSRYFIAEFLENLLPSQLDEFQQLRRSSGKRIEKMCIAIVATRFRRVAYGVLF
jgi:hypothetical protein